VAAQCNVQCEYCNRKYDCANETRPGVTSTLLTPAQALDYLREYLEIDSDVSVVGIAGPGDALASWEETRETLAGVRQNHPDKLICLATNGLALPEHLDEIAELAVSHVTVTVNAIDPVIGSKIYRWIHQGKRVLRGETAATTLWQAQEQGIRGLAERGVTVKVNTVLLPGINDHHTGEIAEVVKDAGAEIMNVTPHQPVAGSHFEDRTAPTGREVRAARSTAGKIIAQMHHCTQCRADAAGLLGSRDNGHQQLLHTFLERSKRAGPERPHVAVGSREGTLINEHLGEAEHLWIYRAADNGPQLVAQRPTPPRGCGPERWRALAMLLEDCSAVFVEAVGGTPRRTLEQKGIKVFETEGLINTTLQDYWTHRYRDVPRVGRPSCSGTGGGCG
jgi:nitrogen fixation protein NifB